MISGTMVGEVSRFGPCRGPGGAYGVGVALRRVFSFRERAARQVSFIDEPRVEGGALLEDLDGLAVLKPCVDVTLEGSVFSKRPVDSVDARVRLGSIDKTVRVHGERRIRGRAGRLTFEREGAISGSLRLGYASAYGGAIGGRGPEKRLGFGRNPPPLIDETYWGYPRNPIGRGFVVAADTASLDGALAPSQEDPADPLTSERLAVDSPQSWQHAPLPAHFGAVSLAWFPRAHWLMTFGEEVRGRTLPDLEPGWMTSTDLERVHGALDAKAASCAAKGMRCSSLPELSELALQGFQWGLGEARVAIPTRAIGVTLMFRGAGDYPVRLLPKTIHVDADAEEVTVVWAGVQQTALPYGESFQDDVRLRWDRI